MGTMMGGERGCHETETDTTKGNNIQSGEPVMAQRNVSWTPRVSSIVGGEDDT